MKELTEIAAKYAAEKTNEVMINAIAKAYADGYRDGYKDREEEIPIDLRSNKTEYVDLGLSSGTLWAKDYEREGGNIVYLTHEKASQLNIPTKAQWEELEKTCRWEIDYKNYLIEAKCVGPNGNSLVFNYTGKRTIGDKLSGSGIFFWLIDDTEGYEKGAIRIYDHKPNKYTWGVFNQFSGYKLPIRLVRTK